MKLGDIKEARTVLVPVDGVLDGEYARRAALVLMTEQNKNNCDKVELGTGRVFHDGTNWMVPINLVWCRVDARSYLQGHLDAMDAMDEQDAFEAKSTCVCCETNFELGDGVFFCTKNSYVVVCSKDCYDKAASWAKKLGLSIGESNLEAYLLNTPS